MNPAENDTSRHRRCPLTTLHLATSLNTWLGVPPEEGNTPTNQVVSLKLVEDNRVFECQTAITSAPLNRWWDRVDARAGLAITPAAKPAATTAMKILRIS